MRAEYIIGAIIVGLVGVGLAILFVVPAVSPTQNTSSDFSSLRAEKDGVPYTEIVHPSGFVNTDGITLAELVGKKVILVEFLTYSCINCQRTFPYTNAWYEKYKDQGLEIVGIHTPEFAFEKNINNVREAMKRFGVQYPIVLDNEYATWNAYGNNFWPRKYLIDVHGNIVYDHIGEGAYEETEMKIRELLEERAKVMNDTATNLSNTLAVNIVPKVQITTKSPETYFGSDRNEYLGNGTKGKSGEQTFTTPTAPILNTLYLGGTWNVTPEYAESVFESRVMYRYNGKEVYLVADSDSVVDIEIVQDGMPVGAQGGADVDVNGVVRIGESRLYKLILNDKPDEHVLELRVKGGGVRFYAFTFG